MKLVTAAISFIFVFLSVYILVGLFLRFEGTPYDWLIPIVLALVLVLASVRVSLRPSKGKRRTS